MKRIAALFLLGMLVLVLAVCTTAPKPEQRYAQSVPTPTIREKGDNADLKIVIPREEAFEFLELSREGGVWVQLQDDILPSSLLTREQIERRQRGDTLLFLGLRQAVDDHRWLAICVSVKYDGAGQPVYGLRNFGKGFTFDQARARWLDRKSKGLPFEQISEVADALSAAESSLAK